uniref:Uncharacterized protein n=1 Tax=Arundo donax TaxID=35708 RepID=A0A0A9A3R5_ARUDO
MLLPRVSLTPPLSTRTFSSQASLPISSTLLWSQLLARKMFHETPIRNTATFNTLICLYVCQDILKTRCHEYGEGRWGLEGGHSDTWVCHERWRGKKQCGSDSCENHATWKSCWHHF